MAYSGDGGPMWLEHMKVVFESFLVGERLRPSKQSAMKSRLPKRMVSSREKPPHIKCPQSVEMASVDEGTIRMTRGKAR
jgi:hypothetical protein